VAIVRVEQLYPLADKHLEETLKVYADGTPTFWVQEEPDNMGAWRFIRHHMGDSLFGRLPFAGISRPASASPATGSASSHKLEQQKIIDDAFGE
jgi:2-oxoglutarate dehydrogenase E1 component